MAVAARAPRRAKTLGAKPDEAFLSARIGAKEITARVPPRGLPAAGSEVELVFNRERLHFFDADSGQALRVED